MESFEYFCLRLIAEEEVLDAVTPWVLSRGLGLMIGRWLVVRNCRLTMRARREVLLVEMPQYS